MNWTRLALAVGLAWVAANLLLKRRRAEPADPDDGLAALPSVDGGLPIRVRAMTVPAGSAGHGGVAAYAPGT